METGGMIFDEYKCIFIHLEKTGGTSIESLFANNGCRLVIEDRHLRARQVAERRPDKWRDYFTFTIVRNPWEKIYSWWWNDHEHGKVKMSFKEHVKFLSGLKGNHISTNQVDFIRARPPIDHIGRFENLREEMNMLIDRFDLNDTTIPHERKIPNKPHCSAYYDDELVELVGKMFEKDIKRFGYEFPSAL